jgi:hypothetical protein
VYANAPKPSVRWKVAAARRVSCSCAAASKPDVELADEELADVELADVELADEELADVELVSALTSTRSSSVASPASVLRHQ